MLFTDWLKIMDELLTFCQLGYLTIQHLLFCLIISKFSFSQIFQPELSSRQDPAGWKKQNHAVGLNRCVACVDLCVSEQEINWQLIREHPGKEQIIVILKNVSHAGVRWWTQKQTRGFDCQHSLSLPSSNLGLNIWNDSLLFAFCVCMC